MDTSTIISTAIGAVAALAGSFGAQLVANHSNKNAKNKEKFDEIGLLLVQVKEWLDFEKENNELTYEHEVRGFQNNTLECPTYKLLALTMDNPHLGEIAKKISDKVHYIKNAGLFEYLGSGMALPNEMLWSEYIKPSCEEIEKYYDEAVLIIRNKKRSTRTLKSILMEPLQSLRKKSIQGATNKAIP